MSWPWYEVIITQGREKHYPSVVREKQDYFSCRMRTYGELREKNPAMNEANSGR